jgi:hypothetical protein
MALPRLSPPGTSTSKTVLPGESWVGLLVDPRADDDHRRVLVSWVPAVFVPLVTAGIEVNPEECIVWLR